MDERLGRRYARRSCEGSPRQNDRRREPVVPDGPGLGGTGACLGQPDRGWVFPFKTTVEDDGADVGGGYQEVTTTLNFADSRAYSGMTRPPVPTRPGHPFRRDPAIDSDGTRPPIPATRPPIPEHSATPFGDPAGGDGAAGGGVDRRDTRENTSRAAPRRAGRNWDTWRVVTKRCRSTPCGAKEGACRSAIRCEKYGRFCG